MFSPTSSNATLALITPTAQHQRRKPPIKTRQPKIERLLANTNNVLSQWRRLEAPSTFASTNSDLYKNLPDFTWIDSAEDPLVEKLKRFKQNSKSLSAFDFARKFWVPNPYAIDIDYFEENLVTYVLNPEHPDNTKKDYLLKKHGGFGLDASSINRLFDWVALKLYNYETNLYSITYNKHGVKATYVSSFQSISEPMKTLYIILTWITSYMWPEKEDVTVFTDKFDYEQGPVLDGWSKLVTLYAKPKLNVSMTDFVKRKKKQDIRLLVGTSDELNGSFQIPDESKLLSCSDDWRKLLVKPPENPLFHFPPASHYSYNPLDLPNGIDSIGPLEGQEVKPIARLPYGHLYGIKE